MDEDSCLRSMDSAIGAQHTALGSWGGKGSGQARSSGTDTTHDWETLLSAMNSYDQATIKGWVDSMNNLLIFAGLFSAVVTTFVVESISWLQPDPSSTSNTLLAQISLQLTSFSVNPNFINSTAVPVPLEPFQPSLVSVRVNVLWITSLAIGLIAALFAILVQQWLADYPVRRVTSVRQGVRLRQLRFDALYDWGVSDIVILLPVLLQIALILFLAGLILLLWSIHPVVACVVTVVLGVPLTFFALTALLPLVSAACPYKSTVTTIMLTFWTLGVAIVTHTAMIWAIIAYIFFMLAALFAELCGANLNAQVLINKFGYLLVDRVARAANGSLVRLASRAEWVNRDVNEVQMPHHATRLDYAAVLWSPRALPHSTMPELDRCLSDLKPAQRAICTLTWASTAFNLSIDDTALLSRSVDATLREHRATGSLEAQMVGRLRMLLLDALVDWDNDDGKRRLGTSMLTLLRHMVKLDPPPSPEYLARYQAVLLKMRSNLSKDNNFAKNSVNDRLRMVARSMLDVWLRHGVPVDNIDLDEFTDWILSLLNTVYTKFADDDTRYDFEEHDSALSLLAVGFVLHQHHPRSSPDALRPLADRLQRFVGLQRAGLADFATLSLDAQQTDDFAPALWPTLCKSLRVLVERTPTQLPADAAIPMIDALLGVFEHDRSTYLQTLVKPLKEIRSLCVADTGDKGHSASHDDGKVDDGCPLPETVGPAEGAELERDDKNALRTTAGPQSDSVNASARGDDHNPESDDVLLSVTEVPKLDYEHQTPISPPSPSRNEQYPEERLQQGALPGSNAKSL